MFANRPRPIIGKLSALLLSGNHAAGFPDMGSSPRGPLDLKIQSPGSLKCYDVGGVGLGIVAALEKSSSSSSSSSCSVGGHEILAKFAVCSPLSFNKSSPIPVSSGRNCDRSSGQERIIKKSPPRVAVEEISVYPTSCFMSSCNLCRKKLHGQDIYMYRGEKAFCSSECRSRQIMMDEKNEECRSEVSTSSSPHKRDQIFSTGIFAI